MQRAQVLAGLVFAGAFFAPGVFRFFPATASAAPKGAVVVLERKDADKQILVLVDGKPFTTYRWSEVEKPSLWPIQDASGATVTRGWPLAPRPGESADHPHHIGLWFNYGDVDGVDFWGNSEEIRKKDPSRKVGTIVQRAIKEAKGAALSVSSDWVMPDGKVAVQEQTRYGFGGGEGRRFIDRAATLTGKLPKVAFVDNKEGAFGLRVADSLNLPNPKNKAGTGQYTSSEGKTGDAVWGQRARWIMLAGKVEDKDVTIAILDHPKNPGHPTYWHARGYGLFAANPFGAKVFSKGKEELNFSLARGKSARFVYRTVILSHEAKAEEIEAEYKAFIKDVK